MIKSPGICDPIDGVILRQRHERAEHRIEYNALVFDEGMIDRSPGIRPARLIEIGMNQYPPGVILLKHPCQLVAPTDPTIAALRDPLHIGRDSLPC